MRLIMKHRDKGSDHIVDVDKVNDFYRRRTPLKSGPNAVIARYRSTLAEQSIDNEMSPDAFESVEPIRCPRCGKLLAKCSAQGLVEIRCIRCRTLVQNMFT